MLSKFVKLITNFKPQKIVASVCLLLVLVMIWQTQSRFAFLAVGFFGSFLVVNAFWQHFLSNKFSRWWLVLRSFSLVLVLLVPILIGLVAINLPPEILEKLPIVLAKPSSTFWHAMRTEATLEILQTDPKAWQIGFGLGASGPAAKMEYYDITGEKIFKNYESVAYKYRLVGQDLTIPENWFLQILLNGGIFYFIGYLSLIFWPMFKTFRLIWQPNLIIDRSVLIALALFGVVLGNLFLHLWEAQIVSLMWVALSFVANLTTINFTSGVLPKSIPKDLPNFR